ncbi:MAG: hypothetical protein LBE38_00990 [Deltaproteobacteria bacterium]|jgi:uncharacterized protein YcfJ|nr:hypothetical protein [Deltaproteobacteria bacterium]
MTKKLKLTITKGARTMLVLSLSLVLMFFVSGCAGGKLGKQTVKVNYYPTCYQPVLDMRADAEKLNQDVMMGAVTGALLGGIAGVLSGGDWRQVAAGVVIGAVAGATISYLASSEVQAKAQAERFELYGKTLDVDFQNIDAAVASARITLECYQKEYTALEANYKAGLVPKEEMLARLQEIRDGTNDTAEILRNYNDVALANVKTYDNIMEAEVARTTDRPSAARVNSTRTKVNQVKAKTDEAAQTEQLLAQLSNNSAIMQESVSTTIQTMMDVFLVQAPEQSVCEPCSKRL